MNLYCTDPYANFWKGVCEFKDFYKVGANLKKILILRPKLGVQTRFLVENCMILKQFAQLGGAN